MPGAKGKAIVKITGTRIAPDGAESQVELDTEAKPLARMQEAVGGYIELVRLGPTTLVVNEEGMLRDLEPNRKVGVRFGLAIMGPAIVFSTRDFDAFDAALPED